MAQGQNARNHISQNLCQSGFFFDHPRRNSPEIFGRWKGAEATTATAVGRHEVLDRQEAGGSAVASGTSPGNPAFSGKQLRPPIAIAYAHLPRICPEIYPGSWVWRQSKDVRMELENIHIPLWIKVETLQSICTRKTDLTREERLNVEWRLEIPASAEFRQCPHFNSQVLLFLFFLYFLFFFYIGVSLINNVVLASSVQQSSSVIHISILFQILSPFKLLQSIEQFPCYTVDPCWLSILNIVMCIC